MQSGEGNVKAIGAAILGNTFFGLSFLFSKVALGQVEPFVLLAVRFVVAFILLNLILLSGKARIRLRGKPIGKILALGLIQPVLYFTFENYGIRGTSSALAGTLLATVPAATLLAGVLFMRERTSWIQVLGAILSMAGVAVISVTQDGGSTSVVGMIFLFCAVLASVGYNMMTKDTAESFTAFERTYVMIALGGLFFTAAALFQVGADWQRQVMEPLSSLPVWGSILYLAGFSSVGAFFLLNYAFSYLSLARASVFTNLVPVISIIAGVAVLKESFTAIQCVGSLAILIGVYVSNQKSPSNKRTSESLKELS